MINVEQNHKRIDPLEFHSKYFFSYYEKLSYFFNQRAFN